MRDIEVELDGKDDIDDIGVPPIQASIDRDKICKNLQLFCLFNNIFIGFQKCNSRANIPLVAGPHGVQAHHARAAQHSRHYQTPTVAPTTAP